MFLFLDLTVFIQTNEPSDIDELPQITFLETEFTVNELCFSKIPSISIIILDDFLFKEANNRQSKLDFLKIKNYTLRHQEITLILVIHNLFGTNLANDILLANHLFLAYSNLGEFIFR